MNNKLRADETVRHFRDSVTASPHEIWLRNQKSRKIYYTCTWKNMYTCERYLYL